MANDKINPKGERAVNIIMLIGALILAAVMAHFFTSCSVQKPVTVIEYRDSIRTEIRERIVHDSVKFEIPVEVEKIVTKDTASHLENRYAESDAVVSGGFLSHSLKSKPQIIYVPVDVAVADTTTYQSHSETETKPQIVEVEKKLTWWQKFRMGAFWWLLILAIVGWRREIISLIKKLIKLF